MKHGISLAVGQAAILAALAACGGGGEQSSGSPPPSGTVPTPAPVDPGAQQPSVPAAEVPGPAPSPGPKPAPGPAPTPTPPPSPSPSSKRQTGAWSPVVEWPLLSIHAALLPDGRVMTYGTDLSRTGTGAFMYDVFDPAGDIHSP